MQDYQNINKPNGIQFNTIDNNNNNNMPTLIVLNNHKIPMNKQRKIYMMLNDTDLTRNYSLYCKEQTGSILQKKLEEYSIIEQMSFIQILKVKLFNMHEILSGIISFKNSFIREI